MMLGKWNMEDALAEAWEEGLEEGQARYREAGEAMAQANTARKALEQGLPAEMVSKTAILHLENIRLNFLENSSRKPAKTNF